MVSYTFRTLKEFYDLLILRVGKHRTNVNLDWGTIVTFINDAIREIMMKTMAYKEWAYMNTIVVGYGTVMPQRFVRHRRVLVSASGEPPYVEARYVDAKEFFSLDNWHQKNIWAQSTNMNPIFTFWGNDVAVSPQITIYLSPNTYYQTGTAPIGYEYNTINVSGLMECYLLPNPISQDADTIPIPYEYEELLILSTLSRILYKTADLDELKTIYQLLQMEQNKLIESYREKKRTEQREIEEFVEPSIPLVAEQPKEGELGEQG